MPSPTVSDVHINRPLGMLSVAFMQAQEHFIADRVFPSVGVPKKGDAFFTYDRGAFNKRMMRKRAPSTESAGGGYKIATDNYLCERFSLHRDIDDEIRDNADEPINLDREATEYLSLQGLIEREAQWVEKFFTPGDPGDIWTFDADGDAAASVAFDPTDAGNNQFLQWDRANSNPIEDIELGKQYVLEETGFEPNKLVFGYPVWRVLKHHPDVVDRIKYSGGVGPDRPAVVTRRALAELLEIDEVLVAKSIEDTSDTETSSHSFQIGKHALLCYAAPRPGIMTPSAGYHFSWTGKRGAGPMGQVIKRMRMDKLDSDRVEIDMFFTQKKIAADLGYFFGSAVQ